MQSTNKAMWFNLQSLIFFLICMRSSQSIDTGACGFTKGCFRYPTGCLEDDCDRIITWKPSTDSIQFEVESVIPKDEEKENSWYWTAVGFSKDTDMADTSVVDCILNGTDHTIIIQNSYNAASGHSNEVLKNKSLGISSPHGSYADGKIMCTFIRSRKVDDKKVFPLQADNKYHIMVPIGPANSSGVKEKHFMGSVKITSLISLDDVTLNLGAPTMAIDMAGCGHSKGCFRHPSGCLPDDCDRIITWKPETDSIQFEVESVIPKEEETEDSWYWTAVGFSKDTDMKDTSVVDCILNGTSNSIIIQNSYNAKTGYSNDALKNRTIGLGDREGAYKDHKIMCSFQRSREVKDDKIFPLKADDKYYLMLPVGPANTSGVKSKHFQGSVKITPDPISVDDVKVNIGAPAPGIDMTTCGKSKGCFRDPPGCEGDHCSRIVTWKPDENSIHFELDAVITRDEEADNPWWWTAIGFSEDTKMNGTSVVDCILNATGHNIIIQNSFNAKEGHSNAVIENRTLGLSNMEGTYSDRHIACKFSRSKQEDDSKIFPFKEGTKYYLELPMGPANTSGTKFKHFPGSVIVTTDPISMHDVTQNIGAPTTNGSMTINLDGCGETKGCYRVPSQCKAASCNRVVTWARKEEEVEFELSALLPIDQKIDIPWVAVGFSNDEYMAGTSVIACLLNASSSTIVSEASYNVEGHSNQPLHKKNLGIKGETTYGSFEDGRITCRFTRVLTVNSSEPESNMTFDLSKEYYFILASGPVDDKGVKHKHPEPPAVSPSKLDISKFADIGGEMKIPLVQAHAAMMIIAWVIVACLGMFIARNMKQYRGGEDLTWFGVACWFHAHRSLMLLTWILSIAALICILVHKKFSFEWNLHPIMGLTTLILAFLNPIIAVFRPEPDASKRSIFNWAHFFLGQFTHLFSFVTTFLGVQLEHAHMVDWSKWLVVGFILWRDVIEISLTVIRRRNGQGYRQLSESFGRDENSEKMDRITFWYLITYSLGLVIIASVLVFNVIT